MDGLKNNASGAFVFFFFKWMGALSISCPKSASSGWSFDVELPPDPEIIKYEIFTITPAHRRQPASSTQLLRQIR